MEKTRLGLLETDGYMKLLCRFLESRSDILESRLFTEMDKLEHYLENHTLDALLVGEPICFERIRNRQAVKTIILFSEQNLNEKQVEIPVIFKYQSAQKLLQEILIYLEEETEALKRKTRCREGPDFFAFFSPCGMGEKPPNSMIKDWIEDREQGGLQIDLKIFSGWGEDKENRGMSELIFYLKQRSEKSKRKLQALIQNGEDMDYIAPAEDYRDLYGLQAEDVDYLLCMLSEETEYNFVFFDVGFVSEAAMYLLSCCKQLYLPEARDSWERNQQQSWKQLMLRDGMGHVLEKIHFWNNSCCY